MKLAIRFAHVFSLSALILISGATTAHMKKSAMIRIDVQDREGPPRGVLKWMLTPKLAGK